MSIEWIKMTDKRDTLGLSSVFDSARKVGNTPYCNILNGEIIILLFYFKRNRTEFHFVHYLKDLCKPSIMVLLLQFLHHCKQSYRGWKFQQKRRKRYKLALSFPVRKWKIAIFREYYGWQSFSVWQYITLMISQCIIFMSNHNGSFIFRQIIA